MKNSEGFEIVQDAEESNRFVCNDKTIDFLGFAAFVGDNNIALTKGNRDVVFGQYQAELREKALAYFK